jgi:hypothetical protein
MLLDINKTTACCIKTLRHFLLVLEVLVCLGGKKQKKGRKKERKKERKKKEGKKGRVKNREKEKRMKQRMYNRMKYAQFFVQIVFTFECQN